MTVSTFIKENRVLVAGLVLPFLLIGLLAFAKTIPASMVPPPTQAVVYYSAGWSPKGQIALKVDAAGTVTAIFNATNGYKPNPNDTLPKTTAYIYTPKSNTTETIDIVLDSTDHPSPLEKLATLTLSAKQPAEDGYSFESYHYRNYSLLTDIFAYRSHDTGPVLSKDGRVIKLPQPTPYYGNVEFLGWVTKGQVQ